MPTIQRTMNKRRAEIVSHQLDAGGIQCVSFERNMLSDTKSYVY